MLSWYYSSWPDIHATWLNLPLVMLGLSPIYCMGQKLVGHYTTIVSRGWAGWLVPMCLHFAFYLLSGGFSHRKCNDLLLLESNTYFRHSAWLDNCVVRHDTTVRPLPSFILHFPAYWASCYISANLSSSGLIAFRIWLSNRRFKPNGAAVSCQAHSTLPHD